MSNISIEFVAGNCLLCWTNFLSTCSFGAVSMIPIFALISFIWRAPHIEEIGAILLVIINSAFF
jgi:hypothetical protein